MTTKKQRENIPSDTQAILAPLGKYAVIAVVMVTTIVTTAIVLNKQMNQADKDLGQIESNLAYFQSKNSTNLETSRTKASNKETNEIALTTQATINDSTIKTKDTTAESSTFSAGIEALFNNSDLSTKVTIPSKVTSPATVITSGLVQNNTHTTKDETQQEYVGAFKVEQKQHMTEIFARISALESQQLDRYKTNQNKQVIRLREQLSQKNDLIESLLLRNKDLYELRKANVQRNQSNREQILNRI